VNKINLGLNLLLVLGVSNFGFSEELKPQGQGTDISSYYPYNPNYGTGQNFGFPNDRPYIHRRVDRLINTLRYSGASPMAMDADTNSLLWTYFNAESSLDMPREDLKKFRTLFETEDGKKTDVASRLASLNEELEGLFQKSLVVSVVSSDGSSEKIREDINERIKAVKEEAKDLYEKLTAKLKKEENKVVAEALKKDVLALPEISTLAATGSPYGHMGGGIMGGGMMGGPSLYAPGGVSSDQLRAQADYNKQLQRLQKLTEEARERDAEMRRLHDQLEAIRLQKEQQNRLMIQDQFQGNR